MAGLGIDFRAISLCRRKNTVIMGIDKSVSMTIRDEGVSRLSVACDGACKVIDSLSTDDAVAVLSFGDEITDVAGGATAINPSSKIQLKRRIRSIRAGGGTKLFDTILAGCKIVLETAATATLLGQALSHDAGRFWFCVLTDGEDTRSSSSLRDVVAALRTLNSKLGPDLMKLMIIGVKLSPTARREMAQIVTAGGPMVTFSDAQNLAQVTSAFQQFVLRMQHTRASVRPARNNPQYPSQETTPGKKEIRPGSLVAIKNSVTTPAYGWRMYNNRNRHGLVVKIEAGGDVLSQIGSEPDGPPTGNLWRGRLSELEVIDDGRFSGTRRGFWTGKLQLGQAVCVPSRLPQPSSGWGSLKRGEVGYVRGILPDSVYVCDFPSCDGWKGREQDLEVEAVATLVRPGENVRVRKEITSPRGGWANITPTSIGIVSSIRYDGVCTVNFQEYKGWKCYLDELETIDRPPTVRATVIENGETNCAGRHGLQAFQTVTHNQKNCDFCGTMSGPSGALMYGCARCDCDACAKCYRDNASRKFQKDTFVILKGLNSRKGAPLNGKTAQIIDFVAEDPKKYIVKCASAADPISIKEDNMMLLRRKYADGSRVRLKGIVKRPELNGEVAKVEEFDATRGRYQICTWDRKERAFLLTENLEPYVVQELF